MKLDNAFNFTDNIRTHAALVGILFALGAVLFIVQDSEVYREQAGQLSEEAKNVVKYSLVAISILNVLITIVYWIGFLKRKRWCLTVIIVMFTVVIPIYCFKILLTFARQDITSATLEIIQFVTVIYILLVTRQLRTVYMEQENADTYQKQKFGNV